MDILRELNKKIRKKVQMTSEHSILVLLTILLMILVYVCVSQKNHICGLLVLSTSVILIYASYAVKRHGKMKEINLNKFDHLFVKKKEEKNNFFKHIESVQKNILEQELKNDVFSDLSELDFPISFKQKEEYPKLKEIYGKIPFENKEEKENKKSELENLKRKVRDELFELIEITEKTDLKTNKPVEDDSWTIKKKLLFSKGSFMSLKTGSSITPKTDSNPASILNPNVIENTVPPLRENRRKNTSAVMNVSELISNKPKFFPIEEEKKQDQNSQIQKTNGLFDFNMSNTSKTLQDNTNTENNRPSFDNAINKRQSQILSQIQSQGNALQTIKEVEENINDGFMEEEEIESSDAKIEKNSSKQSTSLKKQKEVQIEQITESKDEVKDEVKSVVVDYLDITKYEKNLELFNFIKQKKQGISDSDKQEIDLAINMFFSKICSSIDDHFVKTTLELTRELNTRENDENKYYCMLYELILKLYSDTRNRFSSSKISIVS